MTTYDVAMAGIVIAGMIWGACRGITWQLASIASLVLGYTVAQPLSTQVAPHLQQFGGPAVARALAMLLVYVAVSGGIFLAAWIVRSTLRQFKFEAYDRHLGMLMGGMEGALLGMVATLFVVSLAPQTRESIFASPSGRIVGRVMELVGPVLPGEVRQELAPFWNAPLGKMAELDAGPGALPVARTQAEATPQAGGVGPGGNPALSNVQNLIAEGESRLGRVFVETAEKGLQQPAGNPNDRAVERR